MQKVVDLLIKQGKKIATMESCTGGGVANAITNIPGASEVLEFSAVTDSNDAKIMMGIDKDIIDKYSVYSKETAQSMAKAICIKANSDYGVGITGKLSRVDKNNPYGIDNQVFGCIYDKEKDMYYPFDLYVDKDNREDNKKLVIDKVKEELIKIITPIVKK